VGFFRQSFEPSKSEAEMKMEKIAYGIAEVCKLSGLGRTTLYASISSGALRAHKIGRRTILLHDDVVTFLHTLPVLARVGERADG
jgi:excisionase family DNA binding protein